MCCRRIELAKERRARVKVCLKRRQRRSRLVMRRDGEEKEAAGKGKEGGVGRRQEAGR